MEKETKTTKQNLYDNREVSWLKFEQRVLNEARDKNIPLLERLKFISIVSSNLDEFFMVRVASLKDMVNAEYTKRDITGMTPSEQLEAISKKTKELVKKQYNTYNRSLIPALRKNHIRIINNFEDLTREQAKFVNQYFKETVYPVLTPMAVDASRPFPLIRNKTLNIGALLKVSEGDVEFATVQVPSVLPRIVEIPGIDDDEKCFILLEQLIEKNIDKLFLNYQVLCAYPYRVMRNADLSIDEEEAEDLLTEIEKQLKMRQWGEVIRLEVEKGIDKRLLEILKEELNITTNDVFKINGPIDLTFLMQLYGLEGYDHLKNKPFTPQQVPEFVTQPDIFTAIRNGDILVRHPYQTFDPVVNFIKQAALDPNVLAIKQTLYRVSGNSPIVAALAYAAENGKQVTVLVELKARFDEENNIAWAKKLERAGCHVIYGLVGLKTHAKIALVVRKEDSTIRRYVHMGTGNYNDSTAKIYTDCGIFTCDESIGEDATAVFNMLSGYSEPPAWNKLTLAPIWLRSKFESLIHREISHAKEGREARIIAKMNSLCDEGIINLLYEASKAGVQIQLIVRGICCLRAGIPGVSENIEVRSIVGDFLEHSRIYYFFNGGDEEIYMASADCMPRNLDRRVEILFPVLDEKVQKKVKYILDTELSDNVKAYIMNSEGNYKRIDKRGKILISSQSKFREDAIGEAKAIIPTKVEESRKFIPVKSCD